MEFRVLGPLAVVEDARELPLGRPKQRAVLAVLVLRANEVVAVEQLVDALWPDTAPDTARTVLQGHVSRLRKLLGRERLRTRGAGYSLHVADDELDSARFERLVADARSTADPAARSDGLRTALSLWRGAPLPEFRDEPFARAELARLEELRLGALEDRIDADLELGRHAELVGELELLVTREPFRERLRGQLMVALYRAGRQADALEVYRHGRAVLAEEIGLDPGPTLQRLERQILVQDPTLEPPGSLHRREVLPAAEPGPRPRRRALLASAVAGVLAAAIAIPVFALGHGTNRDTRVASGNEVVAIDPRTNAVVAVVSVGARPSGIVSAAGSLWVANLDDQTVSRIDPAAQRVVRTIATLPPGTPPTGLSAGAGRVWYAGGRRSGAIVVGQIDPRIDMVARTSTLPPSSLGEGHAAIAADRRAVWVVSGAIGPLWRLDPHSGALVRSVETRTCCPGHLAVAAGAVWVADGFGNTVTRIDEPSLVRPINVGRGPAALAVSTRALWAVIEREDGVVRIDLARTTVVTTVPVGSSPAGIAAGLGAVWVANSRDGTVSRIDPERNAVVATITVGGTPSAVAVAAGKVWVSVQPGDARGERTKAGGVARVNSQREVGPLDPALAYTPLEQATVAQGALAWQIEYATCAKLLNYPDRPAPLGAEPVPEVAEAPPTVSADGRTYTFTIRPGFRFSPPSGEEVTAATFKYAIERSMSPQLQGPASVAAVAAGRGARATLDDVVGAKAYAAGRARHITGIDARGSTLTIRLERPAVDLLQRIALPFFCAVPPGTPIDPSGLTRVATAGPFYVSAYTPGRELVLERNPNYGGVRPRHLDEIRIALGVSQSETVSQVESGAVDYALDGVPPQEQPRLRARYGPGSPAARAAEQRYFVHTVPAVYFLALNTSRPLFAAAPIRRAVSYAVDRRALVRLASAFFPAEPTDQYLPPAMLGYRDASLYPPTANVAAARKLAAGHGGTAVLYTLAGFLPLALVLESSLEPIGIHLDVRTFPPAELRKRLGRRGEPFDMTVDGWSADVSDPAAILLPLLDGNGIRAAGNTNLAYFDDPAYNRRLEEAAQLTGSARYEAFETLGLEIARDAAPLVALANPARHDFFSRRIGCQIYNPVYGMDLAALCLR